MQTPTQVTLIARIDGVESALDLSPSQINTLTAFIADHPQYTDIGKWCLAQIQAALPAIVQNYQLDAAVQAAQQQLKNAQALVDTAIQQAATLGPVSA